jgi:hypothetical protein
MGPQQRIGTLNLFTNWGWKYSFAYFTNAFQRFFPSRWRMPFVPPMRDLVALNHRHQRCFARFWAFLSVRRCMGDNDAAGAGRWGAGCRTAGRGGAGCCTAGAGGAGCETAGCTGAGRCGQGGASGAGRCGVGGAAGGAAIAGTTKAAGCTMDCAMCG